MLAEWKRRGIAMHVSKVLQKSALEENFTENN